MLYHNIISSSKNRLVKQIILEQRAQNHSNTFYDKVRTIAEELNIKLEKAVIMKKSSWKRTVKDEIQNQIQERVEKEMESKTKLRTVREEENTKCPICNQKEDTTERVLECQTAEAVYKIRDNTPNQWAEVVKLYRQNKELRK